LSFNRPPDLLRIIFIGEQITLLDALLDTSKIVGVYGYEQKFSLSRSLKLWLLSNPLLREKIKKIVLHHPCHFLKWRKHLVRFQISDYAIQHKLPLIQAQSINDSVFIDALTKLKPDLGIIANFGEILKAPLLSIPRYGFINIHPSLLPKYRGPEPILQALLHREKVAGVTWQKVSEKIDAGEILAQKSFQIKDKDTAKIINEKAINIGIGMLPELLKKISKNSCEPVMQDPVLTTYFPKMSKTDRARLNNLTAYEIRQIIK